MSKIIRKLDYLFLKKIKPEIIGGFKGNNGLIKKNTGISNMTHVSTSGDNLKIGDFVFVGHFNYIDAFNAEVIIEDHCQITNYVSILTHSSHNELRYSKKGHLDPKKHEAIYAIKPVKIGKSTYIGPHSVIMPGTVLGKGCLVSAFSYVNGEFPDYSILRGQPARVIGSTRDLDEKILLEYPELKDLYYL